MKKSHLKEIIKETLNEDRLSNPAGTTIDDLRVFQKSKGWKGFWDSFSYLKENLDKFKTVITLPDSVSPDDLETVSKNLEALTKRIKQMAESIDF